MLMLVLVADADADAGPGPAGPGPAIGLGVGAGVGLGAGACRCWSLVSPPLNEAEPEAGLAQAPLVAVACGLSVHEASCASMPPLVPVTVHCALVVESAKIVTRLEQYH